MMLKRLIQGVEGLGFSACAKAASIGSQCIIIALLSRRLSGYEFGVWAVLSHLLVVISLFDFGMGGGGLRNELTKLHAQNQHPSLQKELFFSSFFVIGSASLILLGLNTLFLKSSILLLFRDLSSFEHIEWVFFLFLLLMLLKLPFTLYASGFYAYQEVSLKALLDCGEAIGLVIVIATVAWMEGAFFPLFLSYYLVSVSISIVGFGWFLKRRGWKWRGVTLAALKGAMNALFKTNLLFWIQNLVSIALFSLSPILINILGGVLIAGEYSLIYRLYSLFIGIHFAMLNPLWSYYAEKFYQGAYAELEQKFRYSIQATASGLSLAVVGMMLFYQPVVYLWTGKKLSCFALVMMSGVWMVLYGITNCYSILLNAMNKIGRQVMFLSIGAFLNLFFGILLGRSLGALGVVIAAIIALLPLLFSNILEVMSVRQKGRTHEAS